MTLTVVDRSLSCLVAAALAATLGLALWPRSPAPRRDVVVTDSVAWSDDELPVCRLPRRGLVLTVNLGPCKDLDAPLFIESNGAPTAPKVAHQVMGMR
jgi:hypothetical protein